MRKIGIVLIVCTLMYSCNTAKTDDKLIETTIEPINTDTIIENNTPRVTGIGGIFFNTADPNGTAEWYGENLGLAIDDYGSPFEFRNANNPGEINYLRWSPMGKEAQGMFAEGQVFMINYRVKNIEVLVRIKRARANT